MSDAHKPLVTCDWCDGEGFSGHDCGEDTCCCADPEENITCHVCGGSGLLTEYQRSEL